MASELVSEFLTGAGWSGSPSASLAEAFVRRTRVFDDPLFDNLSAYAIGLAIMVGSWFAGWFVEWLVLRAWGVNWKRLLGTCCGRRNKDEDGDPLFRNLNDPNASANRPKVLPVRGKFSPGGTIGGPVRISDVVGVVPQQYKEVPVEQVRPTHNPPPLFNQICLPKEQVHHDSRLWSGVKPSHTENYVRLTSMLARLVVLIGGLMLAFQAAGVNVLSLAASMGIVTLCFTYGGAGLLRNFLSGIYLHWTCKVSTGVYVSVSSDKQGIVTDFTSQWVTITDDLRPSKGRQLHLIPNGSMMDADITVFPDGPPSDVVLRYFDELEVVNKARLARGLPSLQPIEGFMG